MKKFSLKINNVISEIKQTAAFMLVILALGGIFVQLNKIIGYFNSFILLPYINLSAKTL